MPFPTLSRIFLLPLLGLMTPAVVQAHYIWLVPQAAEGTTTVQVYFSEDASPDDPSLLKRIENLSVLRVHPGSEAQTVPLKLAGESLSGTMHSAGPALYVAAHDLGVLDRGGSVFRLKYYAKGGPELDDALWREADCSKPLRLDAVPTRAGDSIQLKVLFDGQPAVGAEVTASCPETEDQKSLTNDRGIVTFPIGKGGRFSLRARHIEEVDGELDGKAYPATRHYVTLSLEARTPPASATASRFQPFPQPVTSFGATIHQGKLFTYGGHMGEAHSYSTEEHDRFLRQLDLTTGQWSVLGEGPGLQGLALVSHGDKLIRIGGFMAKNAAGEEHDLWSQSNVSAYDLNTGIWSDLPPLPEPRSSFDAAVLGDTIYVIGGWNMAGEAESVWHRTAWSLDLSEKPLEWQGLTAPPFQRRALAVAAHNGRIYAIGGMQQEGGITTRVDVYDPGVKSWSSGPSLVAAPRPAQGESTNARRGGDMTGFGASAFATDGHLYVTTLTGNLQRLSPDGTAWEVVCETPTARFFHRLLPLDDSHLLVVGGANMGIGKFDSVEVLRVAP